MSHAITVADVLVACGAALGLVVFVGAIVLVLTIMNPFRSGH